MAYVYRYTDKKDNIIKYVGIVWGRHRNLRQRIEEHQKYDTWCNSNQAYKIEYITENINTRTDAEYIEAHFISLYKTDHWYNKSKAGWGISSFIKERNDWKEYKAEDFKVPKIIPKTKVKKNEKPKLNSMQLIRDNNFIKENFRNCNMVNVIQLRGKDKCEHLRYNPIDLGNIYSYIIRNNNDVTIIKPTIYSSKISNNNVRCEIGIKIDYNDENTFIGTSIGNIVYDRLIEKLNQFKNDSEKQKFIYNLIKE